jgi:hypothetical protein
MAGAGRKLAGVLLDDEGQARLATVFRQLPPGSTAEVVLVADGPALSLPVELIRLSGNGTETGPLGLLANVSVMRRIAGAPPGAAPAPTPGPLKILVAVAAPDETKTPNAPLSVEQEMDAVLRAVSGVVEESHAQVRILEVASPPPAPPTRPASASTSNSPTPTPATPNGNATCPSATTGSATWRGPKAISPPRETSTRPASTSSLGS